MAKPRNQFEVTAREAAERIDAQRRAGEQLALLPDEAPVEPEGEAEGKVGRPKGAKNKVSSQMRDYLAARGCRLPEDVLIEIAGLNRRDDLVSLAMAQTERVLLWAHAGKPAAPGQAPGSPSMRLEVFRQQYTMILRAAEALLPYMAPKASPDVNVDARTTVFVAAAPSADADPAGSARDVTGHQPVSELRNAPADVRHEMQRNQQVRNWPDQHSDGETRTDEASD